MNRKAWLFRILHDTYLSLYRRQRTDPMTRGINGDWTSGPGFAPEEWLRDDQELDRLRKITGDEIEQALRLLSDAARAVILLDLEGFTELEVAEVIGCPVGTVKSGLACARAALRLLLRDFAGERG